MEIAALSFLSPKPRCQRINLTAPRSGSLGFTHYDFGEAGFQLFIISFKTFTLKQLYQHAATGFQHLSRQIKRQIT